MSAKVTYLDSLRGLAATIVVVTHFVAIFFPYALFGDRYVQTSLIEAWLRTMPWSLAIAGHFAVALFFILSGYVLSLGLAKHRTDKQRVWQAMLKRPVRLGGLVLFTVVLGYALMLSGCLIRDPSNIDSRWLSGFWSTTPELDEFVTDVCLSPFSSADTYNPPLWTIHKELVGSYLVFALIALTQKRNQRWRLGCIGIAGLLTFRSLYVGFVIGMAFAEMQTIRSSSVRSSLARDAKAAMPRWMILDAMSKRALALRSLLFLLPGVWLAGQLHYDRHVVETSTIVDRLVKLLSDFGTGGAAMTGATLVFAAFWLSPRLQRSIDRPAFRYLGRVSFAVYALHFLVLGSLTCKLESLLEANVGRPIAILVSGVLSAMCLLALSELATRWIDQPSIWLSHRFATAVSTKSVVYWKRIRVNRQRHITVRLAPVRDFEIGASLSSDDRERCA
jgi:peptidoglycan/LPS O-acetylase OafA/YrhL